MPDTGIATIGHNRPPPAEIAAEYKPRVDQLVAAANAWARDVSAIVTEEQAGKCEDFLKQLRDEWKAVDDARATEKKPHDEAAKAVQEAFTPLLSAIKACAEVMKPLKSGWLAFVEKRQTEARRKAEEEARRAQEAADLARAAEAAGLGNPVENRLAIESAEAKAETATAAAQVAATARPQIAGELSGRASGFTTTWSATITDPEKAAVHYCRHAKVAEAIQTCANADARAMKENFKAPGCELVKGRRV